MADAATNPSVGLNADTGGTIEGWAHVEQSLHIILTTHFGLRVMREHFGSFVPGLLGQNLNRNDVTAFFVAVTSAIEQWEPRFKVTSIGANDLSRDGSLSIVIEGEYRPRVTYGDNTAEGARRVVISNGGAGWAVAGG